MLSRQSFPHRLREIGWVTHRLLSQKEKLVGRAHFLQAPFSRLLVSTQAKIQTGYTCIPGCGSFEGCRESNLCAASTPSLQVYHKYASGIYAYGASRKFLHTKSVAQSTPHGGPHTAKAHSKKSKKPPRVSHFPAFFAKYPEFQYNPANSAFLEFDRLCESNCWKRKDPRRKKAHRAFKDAMVKEFNDIYGTDESDLNSWNKICTVLDIDPLPKTLQEARDVVSSKHINLVDLTENPTGRVHSFDSLEELRAYTIPKRKCFPRENAYAGGLLKYLLREITSKYQGNRGLGGGRCRRRRGHQ